MIFSYREDIQPPRPECVILVSNPNDSQNVYQVNAVVDIAADMCIIPDSIVQKLGNLTESAVRVRDLNGNISTRSTYFVDIKIADYQFTNIEVLSIPRVYALLGRDILNRFKIILDAPAKIWTIESPSSSNKHD